MLVLDDTYRDVLLVFVGLILGKLLAYSRKIKKRQRIHSAEVVGDAMEFGAMLVFCMSTLALIQTIYPFSFVTSWSKVMYSIFFTVSFNTWFEKVRTIFLGRTIAAWEALLGNLPEDGISKIPSGRGTPASVEVRVIDPKQYGPGDPVLKIEDGYRKFQNQRPSLEQELPQDMEDLLNQLDKDDDTDYNGEK